MQAWRIKGNMMKMRSKKAKNKSLVSFMDLQQQSCQLDRQRNLKSNTLMISKINMFDQSLIDSKQLTLAKTFKTLDITKATFCNFRDHLDSSRIKTQRISDNRGKKRETSSKVIYYRKNNSLNKEKKPLNPQKIDELCIGQKTLQNRVFSTLASYKKPAKRQRTLSQIRRRPPPIQTDNTKRVKITKKNSILSPW